MVTQQHDRSKSPPRSSTGRSAARPVMAPAHNGARHSQTRAADKDRLVIEASPGIPPAIAMLLNEQFLLLERTQARRKLRGMVREMQDQTLAEASRELFLRPEPDPNPAHFRVFVD